MKHINPKQGLAVLPILGILVAIVVLGVGAYYLWGRSNSQLPLQEPETSPTTTAVPPTAPAPTPATLPTPTNQNTTSATIYSSISQGYSFQYLKLWKTDKYGSLTVLAGPDNPMFQRCSAGKAANWSACDVMVSTLPYATATVSGVVKTHAEQLKAFATHLAFGNSATPTTINSLMGYIAPSTTPGGSTYNVVLQGVKEVILVQFPNKKTRSDLNQGQLMVLDSISEAVR